MALEKGVKEKITEVLISLGQNPRPIGHKKLRGGDGFRVRSGNYRIVYTVDDQVKIVEIYDIGHRRDIYRRLKNRL